MADEELFKTRPWRRYFARSFDFVFLGFLLMLLPELTFATVDPIRAEQASRFFDSRLGLTIYVAVVQAIVGIAIAACFSARGTTPGKFMFGVNVRKADGRYLDFATALEREARVFIQGLACGIFFLGWIAQLFAVRTLAKQGITPWDKRMNLKVSHPRLGLIQWLLISLGIAYFLLLWWVASYRPGI